MWRTHAHANTHAEPDIKAETLSHQARARYDVGQSHTEFFGLRLAFIVFVGPYGLFPRCHVVDRVRAARGTRVTFTASHHEPAASWRSSLVTPYMM